MTGIKKQLSTLLDKKMDRKDFLKYLAAAGFMVAGGNVLLQSLNGLNKIGSQQDKKTKIAKTSVGYGMSSYGGRAS